MGFVKRTLSSQGGAIWSMAVNPSHTTLALGCDDGAVRLVSLIDGELEHVRKFDAVKTRLLSLAWGPPQPVERLAQGSSNNARRSKGKGKAKARLQDGQLSEGMEIDDEAEVGSSSSSEDEDAALAAKSHEDVLLVTGCADSTVRIWDARSGRCIFRMTTDKIRGEHTLVWSVAVLRDGTIISGDSMGLVKFWDSRMGVQMQSLQVSKADILALAVGTDGRAVYASGVDQKISQILWMPVTADHAGGSTQADAAVGKGKKGKAKKARVQAQAQDRSHWVIAHSRRMHSHDVRALAVSPSYTFEIGSGSALAAAAASSSPVQTQVPIVISGGLDFSLVYTPASTSLPGSSTGTDGETSASDPPCNPISDSRATIFSESYHRKASYIPQRGSPACFAAEAGLIACREPSGISLWALGGSNASNRTGHGADDWEKALEMELSSSTSWISSALSPSGEWLAISDLMECKVFHLRRSTTDGSLKAKRSHAVSAALQGQAQLRGDLGAAQLHFTADSSRLIIGTAVGARVVVLALPEPVSAPRHPHAHAEGAASVLRIFNQHRMGKKQYAGRAVVGRSQGQKQPEQQQEGQKLTNGDQALDSDDKVETNAQTQPVDAEEATTAKTASTSPADVRISERISTIACMTTSSDGQWLVTSDLARRLHIFNLDSLQPHGPLLTLHLPACSLAFSASAPSILTVGLPNNTIQFFDVDSKRTPAWGKRISSNPTGALSALREPMLGMVYDPTPAIGTGQDTLLLYGATWLCKMKVPIGTADPFAAGGNEQSVELELAGKGKRKLSDDDDEVQQQQTNGRKAERQYQHVKGTPAEVFHKYQPILLLDFTSKGELVVVERPYFNLLGQMAPAFVEQKYGSA